MHCVGIKGGYFDAGASSSWTEAPSLGSLSTAQENNPALENDVFGRDTVTVRRSLKLDNYPIGITRVDGEELNVLGLGINSTLLTALATAGVLTSRTWGYFHGWTGTDATTQLDGNLVLGGYDEAKISGTNLTLPLSHEPNCLSGLLITVSNVVLNLKNGSEASIMGGSKGRALRGCVR